MMIQERRPQSSINADSNHQQHPCNREAGCIYVLITGRRSVSRRNRASWYLKQLNKVVRCDQIASIDEEEVKENVNIVSSDKVTPANDNNTGDETMKLVDSEGTDINLVSVTGINNTGSNSAEIRADELIPLATIDNQQQQQFIVTPNTRVLFLSKSIATSIILDLSPSVVSVSSQNDCVFLDSMFDALKRVLHLLVKTHEIPSSSEVSKPVFLSPKVFVSVIAYTPFVVAKNNQVLVQNRRISSTNIDQVLVEIWICLNRLTQEIHELVSNTCGINLDFDTTTTKTKGNVFVFPLQPISGGVVRHPGSVLEDIYELGLFSSSLMPRLSRLSMITITDGLFSSTNNLNIFRLKSIAVSFVSLGGEAAYPDACFGYTPYIDLMKFIAKTTLGVHLSHQDLINSSQNLSKSKQVLLLNNPLYKLFSWTLHSEMGDDQFCCTPRATNFQKFDPVNNPIEVNSGHVSKFFCFDQPIDALQPLMMSDSNSSSNGGSGGHNYYHDWRSFRQLDRNLDADFEQVLSCLLREGYLIKSVQFKHKEQLKIVARLILHWRHNLDLEQELSAPYWSNTDPFDMPNDTNQLINLRPFNTPLYGDTYCEIIVHGSYSFLHNLYCDKRTKRRSEYRDISYRQFRQLIDSVLQTHERLQYLSRFYRDSSLSKVPSFLLHGNSLLYEQPHTHRLTSTIENIMDESKTSEFQEYWQKISCLDTKSWKNLMHIHTLRLVLEHDQPKHKNIHYQNANGRYTHVQCRRALSAISNFIKSYASFALLEDTTYIKFIYNKDDDLREIETSATKGFIVIRINKLLPIIVIYLMFTSGILDSHRVQIVSYLENQLVNCKLRNMRAPSTVQMDNILKSKTISPSSESSCVLIKSPLERMLKVYSRNFISDYLIHNWAHGLPGSCPYSIQEQQQQQQSLKVTVQSTGVSGVDNSGQAQPKQPPRAEMTGNTKEQHIEGYTASDHSIDRYNLVFGKYLYGVRVVQTITNLPHDIIPSLTANVLSKISAILVNARIKQGFHIAFNNSGILNLVVELAMKDHSNEDHPSSCLCQYIVFPPTATNCQQHQNMNTVLNPIHTNGGISSKPGSLSGSLTANSDSYLKNAQQQNSNQPHMSGDYQGEIKIIKEYWIEQQYGISTQSTNYHQSLQNMRYSEVVDHLFITDSTIFECLLTYDLLQLVCDKLSLFYDLDSSISRTESKTPTPIFSPTTSTNSSNILADHGCLSSGPSLPSTLIEGSAKDGSSKVPLIELEYRFSVMKFLDYCQQASLNLLLFKSHSDYYEPAQLEDLEKMAGFNGRRINLTDTTLTSGEHSTMNTTANTTANATIPNQVPTVGKSAQHLSRKMSVDVNDFEGDHVRREHRSSYQHDNPLNANPYATYMNPIYSPSLNHMFLDTLHKRLKQMHDKELKLSDYDRKKLPNYLKRRTILIDEGQAGSDDGNSVFLNTFADDSDSDSDDELSQEKPLDCCDGGEETIDWRCFLRKGNQENLMIVLVPATLKDVTKWLNFVNGSSSADTARGKKYDQVCPIFVFRCSSTMINDHVLSFLRNRNEFGTFYNKSSASSLESDLSLHFGQPCKYMSRLRTFNDELSTEILPLTRYGALNQAASDEKTLEVVHFRAFLRKIKNTVLKSRFSSLNDAYLSELFVHKDDIMYYINNVDMDTQKKYHVSSQLKSLAEFIKNYEDYSDSLPKEPGKPCNQLLNSILLQKCGLFINQPIARFNESNPLIKQLHDKKLLFLMRSNYKVELPLLEENLAGSTLLKKFIKTSNNNTTTATSTTNTSGGSGITVAKQIITSNSPITALSSSISENIMASANPSTSSLGGKSNDGTRFMEIKCGSVGASGSPSAVFAADRATKAPQVNRFGGSNSTLNTLPTTTNDGLILEAFRGYKCCPITELSESILNLSSENHDDNIGLRHEAHMAEVLRRTCERKESHHYRRVLKSKGNYNQSHSAIDQALKRVDSLGRLEHFCLTPLLFSPSWRSKLAPVRDHTIESSRAREDSETHYENRAYESNRDLEGTTLSGGDTITGPRSSSISSADQLQTTQQEADDRWHQMVCNNYIKEYEQYIQTLGFNSVQIRCPPAPNPAKGSAAAPGGGITATTSVGTNTGVTSKPSSKRGSRHDNIQQQQNPASSMYSLTKQIGHKQGGNSPQMRKGSISTSTGSLLGTAPSINTSTSTYNTGYLIKFLNNGCLVFKVGFCKPYVYSILYSIEGERFNNSNMKINMTAFLDELDNIKVTMHLHSFTYDYHLRSMYSYISGRQLTFSPGYHLISFLDDFRKYYQKAPNYARNHILCGDVSITNIKVSGQQLYNYIVTHNSVYNMEVLEMSSSISNIVNTLSSRTFIDEQNKQEPPNLKDISAAQLDQINPTRSHANDYVLIELKREKVRYRDGKDPDIFDCGLLITHDVQHTNSTKNCLTLKYFLLLTNQRDLYPKLIHTYDNIISGLGCHRPIRLGLTQLNKQPPPARQPPVQHKVSSTTAPSSCLSDPEAESVQSSELQSSGEVSGPQSIISTANSVQSSSSGLQFSYSQSGVDTTTNNNTSNKTTTQQPPASPLDKASKSVVVSAANPKIKIDDLEEAADALLKSSLESSLNLDNSRQLLSSLVNTEQPTGEQQQLVSSVEDSSILGNVSPTILRRKRNNSTNSNGKKNSLSVGAGQEMTICDEEITYLGYFSSDEMDMLKFLQEKTANLRVHMEQIVRLAEVHYRRDYLWHKLMQRTAPNSKSDEVPLTIEELTQLLTIVEAIDLATLDPQLSNFTALHINWYMKLLKAFSDLKQSSVNQHRIYIVKASRLLLLYIDPKCTTAFILLIVDSERGSVELNMLLKDKQECSKMSEKNPSKLSTTNEQSSSSVHSTNIELDQDCQQLINDFINFCATFMWSTFLTQT